MNTTTRPGPLLRSGHPREYKGLGVVGRPVFSAAQQMRSTIRRRIGPEAADLLAIPQISESGEDVDWYAPFEGAVVPWSAATAEERDQALAHLQRARGEFAAQGDRELADGASGDRELFARMLPLSLQIPDDEHIYLVDGRPVVTFWGFQPQTAPADYDVIRDLNIAPRATIQPQQVAAEPVMAVPPRPRPWWWWLLWLLLLLLLLALLLFGLRGCGVAVPGLPLPGIDVTAPTIDPPGTTVPGVVVPGGTVPGIVVPGVAVPGGTGPAAAPLGTVPPDQAAPDGTTPPTQAPKAEDGKAEPPKPPQPPEDKGTPKADDAKAPPPLTIPPEAVKSGSTDFLNGHWRSRTGLIDSETGRPIDMEYEFKDGKGTATVERSDGVKCSAPTQAVMQGGKLVIEQTSEAKCPDGKSFEQSKVECSPGPTGQANCKGVNAGGGGYHVQIGK